MIAPVTQFYRTAVKDFMIALVSLTAVAGASAACTDELWMDRTLLVKKPYKFHRFLANETGCPVKAYKTDLTVIGGTA